MCIKKNSNNAIIVTEAHNSGLLLFIFVCFGFVLRADLPYTVSMSFKLKVNTSSAMAPTSVSKCWSAFINPIDVVS